MQLSYIPDKLQPQARVFLLFDYSYVQNLHVTYPDLRDKCHVKVLQTVSSTRHLRDVCVLHFRDCSVSLVLNSSS